MVDYYCMVKYDQIYIFRHIYKNKSTTCTHMIEKEKLHNSLTINTSKLIKQQDTSKFK